MAVTVVLAVVVVVLTPLVLALVELQHQVKETMAVVVRLARPLQAAAAAVKVKQETQMLQVLVETAQILIQHGFLRLVLA
jgi:hypothetical protein